MKLTINKNRTTTATGTWGTINENRYEIINFEFPEDLEDYNKRIVYYLDDKRVWDTIVDNKAYITNAIAKYDRVKAYVWLTKSETITLKYVCDGTEEGNYYFTYDNTDYYFTMPEVAANDELIFDVATSTLKLGEATITTSSTGTGDELTFTTIIDAEEDFRTKLFELEFYENENAEGIVPTEEQVDGFNTMLTAMNNKINEINTIETNIESAEADRVLAEQGRVNAENTRVRNEETRQENEQTRQMQESDRERRTNAAIADIQDKTAEYNANATAKTNAFNQNATDKTNDFNSNAESKTTSFNTNASNKTTDFNTNASGKTTDFNTNATNKTTAFDNNASSKTTDFNTNATNKTTAFDNNATSKTGDFNDNATAKTTAFNENAVAKTEAFDEHTAEITADIEELQDKVEDLETEVSELSENMPWTTTEQGTSIDITDAAKYSKNKMKVFGNTEQTQYTGKNLFNKDDASSIANAYINSTNSTIVSNANARSIHIPIKPNTTYTISKLAGKRFVAISATDYIAGTVGTNIVYNNTASNLTITTGATDNYLVVFYYLSTADTLSEEEIRNSIQIEEGSTATDYEPYVGGVPAPNPDHPQTIHIATGNNTIKVTRKNLFNVNGTYYVRNQTLNTIEINGSEITLTNTSPSGAGFVWWNIPVTEGENYTISYDDLIENPENNNNHLSYTFSDTPLTGYISDYFINYTIFTKINKTTKTSIRQANGKYMILVMRSTAQSQNTIKKIQVEQGSTATSYESYNETNYPLNLGSLELYRTPNYADYIYKDGNNWYKYNAIEKLLIDETTARTWYKSSVASDVYSVFQAAGDNLTQFPPSTLDVFCDKFIAKLNAGGATINGEGISTNSRESTSDTTPKPIRITILKSRLSTDDAAGFKAWLENNNLTVYIALNTPTTTQITDTTLIEQLETIYNKIATVKGTNHVTITATDIAPYVTLNYMQDLPSKLDNLASRVELLEG